MKLDAYSQRDLQHTRGIVSAAIKGGLNIEQLARELDRAINTPRTTIKADRRTPRLSRERCPSCSRGVVVASQQQGVSYRICVDRKTGKAGCGWSEVI